MKKFIVGALAVAPMLASAQQLTGFKTLLGSIGQLIDLALPIVVALGLLGFFFGLAKFIFSAGDPEKQKEGRQIMIWGVVALFVMVSVWGLVKFVGNALNVDSGGTSGPVPSVQGL
jgi:hypothetical protein